MPETNRTTSRAARIEWPLLLLLIAASTVLLAGCAAQSPQSSGQEPGQAAEERGGSAGEGEQASRGDLGHPTLGDAGAPVVMVEYGDFRCGFCGRFARGTEPKLIEEYVEDGTLRIEWRDFPYLGQESLDAAVAARAAQEQGGFWEYHDLLYRSQPGGFPPEKLVSLAGEAGLDVERFEADLGSPDRYARAVASDFREGQQRGIAGTPTFVINGRVIAGAQPLEVFRNEIERAKREAEGGS